MAIEKSADDWGYINPETRGRVWALPSVKGKYNIYKMIRELTVPAYDYNPFYIKVAANVKRENVESKMMEILNSDGG
jgi:hypothetical protein